MIEQKQVKAHVTQLSPISDVLSIWWVSGKQKQMWKNSSCGVRCFCLASEYVGSQTLWTSDLIIRTFACAVISVLGELLLILQNPSSSCIQVPEVKVGFVPDYMKS